MKTEEDEAFDELAKRQGAWGGGFPAKRKMAADKLQEPEREALKLALEALESSRVFVTTREKIKHPEGTKWYDERITAIKEALAQPAQEPVGWADLQKKAQQIVESKFLWKRFIDGTPLANDIACWMADFARQYTTPPQREWVGLTAEDFSAIKFPIEMRFPAEFRAGARWADVKLKEKNT